MVQWQLNIHMQREWNLIPTYHMQKFTQNESDLNERAKAMRLRIKKKTQVSVCFFTMKL